jgi:hypothetical protein
MVMSTRKERTLKQLRGMSNEQWNEIATLSGLPEAGRSRIKETINLYRSFKDSSRWPPAEVRDEFKRLRRATGVLLRGLIGLEKNADAHFALTVVEKSNEDGPLPFSLWTGTKRHDAYRHLKTVKSDLRLLAKWFLIASKRVKGKKRGPDTENVYWLVTRLDVIREMLTGKKLVRSTKRTDTSREYIKAVCKIADPSIGDGTIERAMKERIKHRGLAGLARNSRAK